MEKSDALRIVEALRSGVPSRKVSSIFTKGREEILEKVYQDFNDVQNNQMSKGILIKGEYGEGKTHLLNQIFNEAHSRNFVVSLIPLSKETPLDRLGKIYQKVAASTFTPGAFMPGFEKLLNNIKPDSETFDNLCEFAEATLHKKIYYVLRNYFRCDDSHIRFLLFSDLMGSFIPIPKLRAIHRINFDSSIRDMPRFTTEHQEDYFILIGFLFRKLKYSGWILLFDEAELIGKLSILRRANAYINMWSFIKPNSHFNLQSTYTIFSITSSFFIDVLEGKQDIIKIPQKLNEKGKPGQSSITNEMIKYLQEGSLSLNRLTDDTVIEILREVKNLHNIAYEWSPTSSLEDIIDKTRDTRLRTKIRAFIETLDLEYLYREKPDIQISEIQEKKLEEDKEFFEDEESER